MTSSAAASKGVILAGEKHDGYPEVITSGKINDKGIITGGIGSFDPEIKMSPFSPISIVPKGQKAADNDDSNVNKDRLIVGGGQSGFAQQAYYRE